MPRLGAAVVRDRAEHLRSPQRESAATHDNQDEGEDTEFDGKVLVMILPLRPVLDRAAQGHLLAEHGFDVVHALLMVCDGVFMPLAGILNEPVPSLGPVLLLGRHRLGKTIVRPVQLIKLALLLGDKMLRFDAELVDARIEIAKARQQILKEWTWSTKGR